MVLALYVVAGVMVLGGLTAIYSGSDIIVMERGWTMVIAGSVMAASGALLAGIATAVSRLQQLQGEFGRLSERLARPQAPVFAPDLGPAGGRAAEPSTAPPLVAAPEINRHRDLDITPEPILTPPPTPERAAAGPLPEEPPIPVPEPPAVAPEPEPPIPEEIFPAAPPGEAAEPAAPTVVGTYNSGGNFYIMYSDGSIEAETPAGKFRFDSLDELKDFIAAGGDKAKATS